MEEKILSTRKLGMPVLLGNILLILAVLALCLFSLYIDNGLLLFLSILLLAVSWIPLLGLKVLKPQEALVL
ncbi:MAG: SPFH domain-containing protein, partial [Clostridiales bacterium]|nr:SPFH domain-containing protein [Clostridiales bacterium]